MSDAAPRIVLFDWTAGGHHPVYLRRAAEALAPVAEVVLAVPDETADLLLDVPAQLHRLGPARPRLDERAPARPQFAVHAAAEIGLWEQVAAELRPDHLVHLYADQVLRRLTARPALHVRTSLLFFFPRAHYGRDFGTPLPPQERLRGLLHEAAVARWRRRPDAHAMLTLDEVAAARWARFVGAPAYWFPEPPVAQALDQPADRDGVAVYGALAARKGIDRLADAACAAASFPRVVLAGSPDPDFAPELERLVARMQARGVTVDVRGRRHDEQEGLAVLAAARVAILLYPAHFGMSRVLLEAASVGTPVVVHDAGLLAHLVRTHGLGRVVDSTDPEATARAIIALSEPAARDAHAPALERFASRYSPLSFQSALSAALLPTGLLPPEGAAP